MKSCITISLVPEAKGGPFVLWDGLEASINMAVELGYDAVELFLPGPESVDAADLKSMLDQADVKLAAVGTGAGWVRHRLTLTSHEADVRRRAVDFVRTMIDFAGPFGAPAIIGSMQGNWDSQTDRETSRAHLVESLEQLQRQAEDHDCCLIYEPLNRYESNLCNTLDDALTLTDGLANVKLLADLFHMNIEEADIAAALRKAGSKVGHVHFVDSNRRPAGAGHIDFVPIISTLQEIGFDGYLSAEALPLPTPEEAAKQTIRVFRTLTD